MKLPNLGTHLLTSCVGYTAVVCNPLACLPEAFGNVGCRLLRLLGAHYLAHASLVSAFVNRGALRAQVCKVPQSQLLPKPRPELLHRTEVGGSRWHIPEHDLRLSEFLLARLRPQKSLAIAEDCPWPILRSQAHLSNCLYKVTSLHCARPLANLDLLRWVKSDNRTSSLRHPAPHMGTAISWARHEHNLLEPSLRIRSVETAHGLLRLITNVTYMSLCFVCEMLKPPIGVMKVLTI